MQENLRYSLEDQKTSYSGERFGPQAFNLEYKREISDKELYDEVVSYLGEYRLDAPKYQYELVYAPDVTGKEDYKVRDTYQGESMQAKAHRSVSEKYRRKEYAGREIAEEKGVLRLEEQLEQAKTGDTVLWFSPPGAKEDGYGDYAFLYHGQVVKHLDGSALLAMSAIRIDKPTLAKGSEFFQTMTGQDQAQETPEDFIADPVVLPFTVPESLLDRSLAKHFGSKSSQEDQQVFEKVIAQMKPQIEEFVTKVKLSSREDRIKYLYGLENYALKLKKEFTEERRVIFEPGKRYAGKDTVPSLAYLRDNYGKEPPRVGGSCGSSGKSDSLGSSAGLSFLSGATLSEAVFGNESKECGDCSSTNADNHYHCPGCNKKYSDETSKSEEQRTKKCQCGFKFGC